MRVRWQKQLWRSRALCDWVAGAKKWSVCFVGKSKTTKDTLKVAVCFFSFSLMRKLVFFLVVKKNQWGSVYRTRKGIALLGNSALNLCVSTMKCDGYFLFFLQKKEGRGQTKVGFVCFFFFLRSYFNMKKRSVLWYLCAEKQERGDSEQKCKDTVRSGEWGWCEDVNRGGAGAGGA